jgi:CRP-like cAMP-binding protein
MTIEPVIEQIRNAEPWNARPEPAWPELKAATCMVSIPKHQVVFQQTERGRGVFFVASGLVKLSKCAAESKDTVIFLAQAGDTVGEQILGTAHR